MQWFRLAAAVALLIALTAGAAPADDPTSQSADDDADVENGGPTVGSAPAGTGTGTPVATGTPSGDRGKSNWLTKNFPFVLLGGVFLLWFWMGQGRKKEQKKRKVMLDSLRKGDKVTTAGGIIGTVVDIREDEVTLKVDESANVRLKFVRGSVRHVGDPKSEDPRDGKK